MHQLEQAKLSVSPNSFGVKCDRHFQLKRKYVFKKIYLIVKQFRVKNVEKCGLTLSPPSLQGKHTSLTLFCNKLCIISSQLHPCLNRAHVLFHFCFKCVHPENQKPQCNLLSLSQMLATRYVLANTQVCEAIKLIFPGCGWEAAWVQNNLSPLSTNKTKQDRMK